MISVPIPSHLFKSQNPQLCDLGRCQINPCSILPRFIVIQKICLWFIIVSNILSISDFAMSLETIIVGDERGQFVYRSGNDARNVSSKRKHSPDAVALVFARDRKRAHGNCSFYYVFISFSNIFMKLFNCFMDKCSSFIIQRSRFTATNKPVFTSLTALH